METLAPDPFEQILASLTSGVIALDKDGVIITSNPAARRHLNVGEAALRPGSRLDAACGVVPFVDVVQQVMTTHEPVSRHEIVLPQEGGKKKLIGLSASLLRGPEGFNGAIFLFIDITEMRELERAAELNRELAQIGELAAGIVHELRNPLSVISGTAELLERKFEPNDERRDAVETIAREAAQLEKAVGRILGYARPFRLNLERCRPEAIVERAVRLCSQDAEKKGVNLRTACDEDLPVMMADLEKASQAVANIVGNAIDAVSEDGEVALTVRRDDAEILFEIVDNGPGIHLGLGEDLFKPFFTMKDGGTGLGLSIVRRIATAHRGSVTCANRDEGGARFEFRLPIEP